jgi:hypothetical protein
MAETPFPNKKARWVSSGRWGEREGPPKFMVAGEKKLFGGCWL